MMGAAISAICMSGNPGRDLISGDYPRKSVRQVSFKGSPSAGNITLLQKRAKRCWICSFTRKSLNLH